MDLTVEQEKLWQKAITQKSFIPLLSSRKLLYYWQKTHPNDYMKIAKLASHRLDRHLWYEDKCEELEDWLRKNVIGQIALKT